MQRLTQRVRHSSNNAGVVTDAEDASGSVSGRDHHTNIVANLSAIVGENNETATNGADDSRSRHCPCVAGSATPRCHNNTHAVAFRRRHDYEAVVVDAQRSTSAIGDVTPRSGDVADGVVECGRAELDDDDDEAWTTTSGSYSAGDLCDEIDQLFFAQNRDKISVRPANDTLNLSN